MTLWRASIFWETKHLLGLGVWAYRCACVAVHRPVAVLNAAHWLQSCEVYRVYGVPSPRFKHFSKHRTYSCIPVRGSVAQTARTMIYDYVPHVSGERSAQTRPHRVCVARAAVFRSSVIVVETTGGAGLPVVVRARHQDDIASGNASDSRQQHDPKSSSTTKIDLPNFPGEVVLADGACEGRGTQLEDRSNRQACAIAHILPPTTRVGTYLLVQ
eukprot:3613018-Prymnesium_polylepis.1